MAEETKLYEERLLQGTQQIPTREADHEGFCITEDNICPSQRRGGRRGGQVGAYIIYLSGKYLQFMGET